MKRWGVSKRSKPSGTRRLAQDMNGLFAGTPVAVAGGWRAVETLKLGDKVWTFDSGLQPVTRLRKQWMWSDDADTGPIPEPLLIPAGALANETDLTFLPGTGLLLECENASDAVGDPFAVIPVQALEGLCGIERDPAPRAKVLISIGFQTDEVIYIDSGLLAYCPVETTGKTDENTAMRYYVQTLGGAQDMLTDLDLAELALRDAEIDFFGDMAQDRVA